MIHPGFLRAICEDPDDDAHRLIYADWLDDHGDADRAEFIRLQCALALLDDEDEAMTTREAELWQQHGETWRAELPVLPKVNWGNTFRRGFVDAVSIPNYKAWRNQGLAMLATTPLELVSIHRVTPNTVRRLARSPGIDRVRGLEFPIGQCWDDDLEVLGESCRLRAFCYGSQSSAATINLEQNSGHVIGTSPGFRGLRWLFLANTRLGDGGVARLTSAPNLAGLERLWLSRCDLTAVGVGALTGQASWSRLRSLSLCSNYAIQDEGARKVSSCPGLSALRTLRLSDCGIGSAGATAIARSMFLTNLRLLDLDRCPIGSDGLHALMTSSNMCNLRILNLASTNINGEDLIALLRSPLGTNLRELDVSGIPIDADSAVAIVSIPDLDNLTDLTVSAGEANDLLRQHFGDRITIK